MVCMYQTTQFRIPGHDNFISKVTEMLRPLSLHCNRTNVTSIVFVLHDVTGRGGPWDWKTSRLPHFLDSRSTDGSEVSLTRRPAALCPPGRFLVLISVRG
jgi:hypothetical protein